MAETGNGYGHLAMYPAQLVIKTVDDVTKRMRAKLQAIKQELRR